MKFIFSLSISLLMLGCLSAQTPKQKYTVTSKKAIEYFELGQSAMMIDSLNEALAMANKAIDKEPMFAEAYLLRSYVYADKKDYQTAIDNIEKAISINPDFFPAMYLDLGGLYFELHQFDKAKEILTRDILSNKEIKENIIKIYGIYDDYIDMELLNTRINPRNLFVIKNEIAGVKTPSPNNRAVPTKIKTKMA